MTVVSDTSDEFRKQFEIQKAELENDISKYKERIDEQENEIQKLKGEIVELEAREPSERVVEKVVEKTVEGEPSEVMFCSEVSNLLQVVKLFTKLNL